VKVLITRTTCHDFAVSFPSYSLEEAVKSKLVQTKVVTVTQTLVDGKVVSESKDVQSSSAVAAY